MDDGFTARTATRIFMEVQTTRGELRLANGRFLRERAGSNERPLLLSSRIDSVLGE